MSDTYLTVPTRLVESQSDRFARRRWSNTSSGQHTALFAQYFHGGMDHLNPLLTDGVAESRKFILYNGRGVASSARNARTCPLVRRPPSFLKRRARGSSDQTAENPSSSINGERHV
ncbi:hypothetical protein PS720_01887 [Pseudomonas fluorescens]|nr:hypothetical protein PS720_01887 [Pseudomonas fluorescens]